MFIIIPDLTPGDCVSVFADVEGKCKRGLVVEYEGRTLFVGNGHVKLSRQDLFGSHATNRLDGHHTLSQTTIQQTCSMHKTCFAAELLANIKPVYSTQHIILLEETWCFRLYPVLLFLLYYLFFFLLRYLFCFYLL